MLGSDVTILNNQSDLVLAEWWCQLNRWDWPDGLPDPVTEKERTNPWTGKDRASQIMRWINEKIGHKKCNRQWNKDRMTDSEHEAFWKNNFEN